MDLRLPPPSDRTVTFAPRAADLAFYNVTTGGLTIEPIQYVALVGSSSRDLPLAASFTVDGG